MNIESESYFSNGASEQNKKNESENIDTFEFNENIVTEPKEGDLVLCSEEPSSVDEKRDNNYEWAFLPMKNQLGGDNKVVILFDPEESDEFIKETTSFISKHYPEMKPGIFKIDMKAYNYLKEEEDYKDVVFIKVNSENFHEKWKIKKFGPLGTDKEDI